MELDAHRPFERLNSYHYQGVLSSCRQLTFRNINRSKNEYWSLVVQSCKKKHDKPVHVKQKREKEILPPRKLQVQANKAR